MPHGYRRYQGPERGTGGRDLERSRSMDNFLLEDEWELPEYDLTEEW